MTFDDDDTSELLIENDLSEHVRDIDTIKRQYDRLWHEVWKLRHFHHCDRSFIVGGKCPHGLTPSLSAECDELLHGRLSALAWVLGIDWTCSLDT